MEKGKCGELCYRTACKRDEAFYYNVWTYKYYCRSCALSINPYSYPNVKPGEMICFDIKLGDDLREQYYVNEGYYDQRPNPQ